MAMSQRMWLKEQERRKRERMRRAKRRRNCTIFVFVATIIAVALIILINNRPNNTEQLPVATSQALVQSDTELIDNPYKSQYNAEDIRTSFFDESAFAGNALAETIAVYNILKETDFYCGLNADVENVSTFIPNGSTVSIQDNFKSKTFKKIFIAFGENELKWNDSGEFKARYSTLVKKIKKYQPNAKIYLISIPPVTKTVSDAANDGMTMDDIKEYNKRIKSIAVTENVMYIDSVDALENGEGYLYDGVSYDGINLNKDAVIDLLYYMTKNAYVPEPGDMADEEEDIEQEEKDTDDGTKKETKEETKEDTKATKQPEESPEPTVNVLKDSTKEKGKYNEE